MSLLYGSFLVKNEWEIELYKVRQSGCDFTLGCVFKSLESIHI